MPRIPTYTAAGGGPQVQFQGAPYHLPYPLDAAGLGQSITNLGEKIQDAQNRIDAQLDANEAVTTEALYAAGMKKVHNRVMTEPDSTHIDPATGETVVVPVDRRKMFGDLSRQLQQDVMGTIQRPNVRGAFANHVQKTYPNDVVDADIAIQKKQALDAYVGVQNVSDRYARLIADETDPTAQKQLRDTFKDYMTSAQARGQITPEQAYQISKRTNEQAMERGMVNLGESDPTALFNNAREGKYNDVDPIRRFEILRATQAHLDAKVRKDEQESARFTQSQLDMLTGLASKQQITPDMFEQGYNGTFPGVPEHHWPALQRLQQSELFTNKHDPSIGLVMQDYHSKEKRGPEDVDAHAREARAALDQIRQHMVGSENSADLTKAYKDLETAQKEARSERRGEANVLTGQISTQQRLGKEAVDANKPPPSFMSNRNARTNAEANIDQAKMTIRINELVRVYKMAPEAARVQAEKEILGPKQQQRQHAAPDPYDEALKHLVPAP